MTEPRWPRRRLGVPSREATGVRNVPGSAAKSFPYGLAAALVLAGAIAPAWAQSGDATKEDPSAGCLGCHAGKPEEGGLDEAAWTKSTHSSILGCGGCHSDGFDDYPHKGKKADAPDCTVCHSGDATLPYNRAAIETDVQRSVHVTLLAKLNGRKEGDAAPVFPCTSCHSPHTFQPVRDMPSIAEAVRQGNAVCLNCHARADAGAGVSSEEVMARLNLKHEFIPVWDLHTRAARCVDCHTPGQEETIHRILPAIQAQRDCVSCHSRDSLLLRKLYRHVAAEERSKGGVVNSVIYNDAYLIGATKFEWLDRISLAVFGLTLGALLLHGLGRWAASRSRR